MKKISYNKYSDDELLGLRLKDLDISIAGTNIDRRISRLYEELELKGIAFKPHCWISDEWFTPDNTPGFAIPFYLFHPRFLKLEKDMMYEAEGEKKGECMKILRHETGHAISHAYQLYNREDWQQVFGDFNKPYPLWYTPDISSKDYVTHLNAWYAQAHPLEDFAESFAVWLDPGARWRRLYKGWSALNKIDYIERLFSDIGPPLLTGTEEYAELKTLNYTIGEHYRKKKKFYTVDWADSFDNELLKIFTKKRTGSPAAEFVRSLRKGLRRNISDILDIPQYTVNQLIFQLVKRCGELDLYVKDKEKTAEEKITIIITAQCVNLIHSGYHRIPL